VERTPEISFSQMAGNADVGYGVNIDVLAGGFPELENLKCAVQPGDAQ